MRFYTTTILSANQELTPEGFLLCRDVAIARTGTQLYGPGEVPIEAVDGLVRIERTPDEVFAPRTIASFELKAITIDHPTEDVVPANWSRLAKGTVVNVRRGAGIDADLLLADLLVTDAEAIAKVRAGLREVSCGYDADYLQIEPGRGMQINILGNHLALVERGRCGSRCAIGDSQMRKTNRFLDMIRAAFKNRDEAELEKVLEASPVQDDAEETEEEKKAREAKEKETADAAEEESKTAATAGDEAAEEKNDADADGKTADSLARIAKALDALTARLDKLEGTQDEKPAADEEEDETDEQKKKREDEEAAAAASDKARDSAAVVGEAQDVVARAEILAPGLSIPTFDAAMTPAKVRDSLCQLRLKAVTAAFNGKHKDALTPFLGANPDFAKLTCDKVASAFMGASEIVRRENNAQAKVTFDGGKNAAGVANTISSMNRRNAEFWNRS